ncbi:hypothetical protein A374_07066 [Fictibacillus macauensis ZFHKF-1]|uniref:Uncharacterized protein n=1 Tax=Fictibacillus macauensis ZFHKF-1 TaxID=1196324 RepID=I8J2T7_9BACL|nr:hypothetical protein [Fictibacillus macauensis]EIT86061.1 hypothetical protein A374_07066 [Fictibacillus macauensis ZFHKF-1]
MNVWKLMKGTAIIVPALVIGIAASKRKKKKQEAIVDAEPLEIDQEEVIRMAREEARKWQDQEQTVTKKEDMVKN